MVIKLARYHLPSPELPRTSEAIPHFAGVTIPITQACGVT